MGAAQVLWAELANGESELPPHGTGFKEHDAGGTPAHNA